MSVRLGIVMDPIAQISYKKDSSLAMLLAAQARGWSLFYMEQKDLYQAAGWVERAMLTDGADRKWAVLLDDGETPVGFTALYGIGGQLAPELGCVIAAPEAWGKGVGREAERLTLTKAFDELDAHRVYGRIPATNEAAKHVVTWLGWKHEGTMRDHIRRPDGTLIATASRGMSASSEE